MSLAGPHSDPLTRHTANAGKHTSQQHPRNEKHLSSRYLYEYICTYTTVTSRAPAGSQDAMKSSEVWLRDYETAKQLADDTLAMIQVVFNVPSPLLHTHCVRVLWALVTFHSMHIFMLNVLLSSCRGRADFWNVMVLCAVPGTEYQIPARGSGGLSCDSRRSEEAGLTGDTHRQYARRCGVSLLRQHVSSCCLLCTAIGCRALNQRVLAVSQYAGCLRHLSIQSVHSRHRPQVACHLGGGARERADFAVTFPQTFELDRCPADQSRSGCGGGI